MISKVRENVSNLCSLCNEWILHRTQNTAPELQRQIDRLKNEIRLQLNPKDIEDIAIEHLLTQLPSWTSSVTPEIYRMVENDLIEATQRMLKREWDKVKDEAAYGDLRQGHELPWYKRMWRLRHPQGTASFGTRKR